MLTATRIDEFAPDNVMTVDGRMWLQVNYNKDQDPMKDFPKIVEYTGIRFFRMSFNSDGLYVAYAEAQGRQWHERYMLNVR